MKTLLEYITFVKGIEYLIVVAFCFGFIALWMLTHRKETETIKKVVQVVVLLALVFGGAAVVVATNGVSSPEIADNSTVSDEAYFEDHSSDQPVSLARHDHDKWLKVNSTEYLAITYGQATKFHRVMSEKVSCQTCHHNSGDEIHACKDCHDRPFNPEDSGKPGLKAAYHQRCMSCHREVFGGPESCIECHTGETPASTSFSAPARPHELTWDTCIKCHKDGIPNGGQEIKIVYHDSCLKCHTKNIAGAAKVPADHKGRASNTCDGCHKPGGGS